MKFLIQFSFYVVCIVLTVMLATCKGWPIVPWVVLAAGVPLLVKKFGFSSDDDDIPPPPSSGDDIPPPPTDPPSLPPPPELPLPVPNPGGDGQSPMARESELEFEEDEEDKEMITRHSPQALPQGDCDRLGWLMRFMERAPIDRLDPDKYRIENRGYGWHRGYEQQILSKDEFADMSGAEGQDEVLRRLKDFVGLNESDYRRIDDYFRCLAFRPDVSTSTREESS